MGRANAEWASAVLAQTLFLGGALLGPCCCTGFALVAVSGAHSLVAVHGLLLATASPVTGCSSGRAWAQQLWTPGRGAQVQ